MKILLIIIFHTLCSQDIHRGCMNNNNSRSYGVRPTLSETYLSPSEHFLIHYDNPNSDKAPIQEDIAPLNGIPDYVEEVAIIADLTRSVLIDSMGFRPEVDDEDGKYDIYIVNLGSGFNFAYGWNYTDDNDGIEGTSWVEIDNDYAEDSYYTNGLTAMRATVAHEFFHAIQRAYHEKSSGTYIEGGLAPVNYSYFYEFSSMWLEDIIVPNSNDYLYFLSSTADERRFFSNPEQKFSDTDGYSVALYGHYLSNIIEQTENQKYSTIIRQAWEKFSDELLDPVDALDEVLSNYNSSFIESWVDFCSRNFHNGQFPDMNNDIYYYTDQTSVTYDALGIGIEDGNLHKGYIGTTQTLDTLSLLNEENYIEIDDLDDFSIEMHTIISDSTGLLTMSYSGLPFAGKYIIVDKESADINSAIIDDVAIDPIVLNRNNTIHFIYGGSNPSLIDVSGSVSFFPGSPVLLSASAIKDGIELLWESSYGDELTYNVYRDNILISQGLTDTVYIDNNIDPITEYQYAISCSNLIGESELSNSISELSWPSDSQVTNAKIVSIYPNPISRLGISDFNVIVDYASAIDDLQISIYDIDGRLVSKDDFGARQRGRFEEHLGYLLNPNFSSGIYFLHINGDDVIVKQKFTILK